MGAIKPFGDTQYFEDFAVGDRFRSPPVGFSEAGIVEFAKCYDPQPFHTDPEAAKATPFGGLIASGFQVLGEMFSAMVRAGFLRGGGIGAPGLDEVRWHKPVRPGDTLTMEATVVLTKPSSTRADRGYATLAFAAQNQRGETVMSYRCVEILKRRGA
jgi:acyl dehydratase